jgi:hypothetical protein
MAEAKRPAADETPRPPSPPPWQRVVVVDAPDASTAVRMIEGLMARGGWTPRSYRARGAVSPKLIDLLFKKR